ncbi:condensation domain-containing protein, partial [Streptomyces cirratus]
MRHLSPTEQEAELDSWQLAERGIGYDWTNPPLMRFTVHELADDEFMFSMSFHDALLDGWSESSLITEILADYWALRGGAEKTGRPSRPALRRLHRPGAGSARRPRHRGLLAAGTRRHHSDDAAPPRGGTRRPAPGTMGFLSVDIDPELSQTLGQHRPRAQRLAQARAARRARQGAVLPHGQQ